MVAVAKCKEGEAETLRELMSEVAAASHEEDGCIALHVDKDDPNRLVVVERWESQEALDNHLTLPHVPKVAENIDMLAEPPQVFFCEAVSAGGVPRRARCNAIPATGADPQPRLASNHHRGTRISMKPKVLALAITVALLLAGVAIGKTNKVTGKVKGDSNCSVSMKVTYSATKKLPTRIKKLENSGRSTTAVTPKDRVRRPSRSGRTRSRASGVTRPSSVPRRF